jgi:uncharacterized protein (DUF58 family)
VTPRPLVAPAVSAPAVSGRSWPFGIAPRMFLLLAAGLVLLAPAWIDRRAAYAVVAWDMLIVALWVLDARRLPSPFALQLRREWSQPLTIGRRAGVDVGVRNDGPVFIRAWLTDHVAGTLRRELPEVEVTVAAGAEASERYSVEPEQRGDVAMGRLFVTYRTAWGLAERWAEAPLEQTVRVYPDMQEARRHSMYLVRSRQVAIEKRRARSKGLGRDFESLRDHREGDELRDVCWSATARRAKIVSKVYQPERSQAVWIIVDGGRLLRARVGRQTKLDCMVTAALALTQVALIAGDRVALLTYGRRVHQRIAPARGPQHLRTIVEALATVSAQSVEADHVGAAGAVMAAQKQRALIVWLTDIAETAGVPDVIESASRLSPRHAVVFAVMGQPEMTALAAATPESPADPYRILAAQETLERRDGLLRGLRQRGVLALELTPGELTAALVSQYLTAKERNLV